MIAFKTIWTCLWPLQAYCVRGLRPNLNVLEMSLEVGAPYVDCEPFVPEPREKATRCTPARASANLSG